MRPATLTSLLFVVFINAATAQKFSLLPQVGFENNYTSLSVNNQAFFNPLGSQITPRAALRMDYKLMKNHGLYLAASTSRSAVTMNFRNAESTMSNFTASAGKTNLRLEGGYKLSSKPMYFTKSKTITQPVQNIYQRSEERRGCGGYSRSDGFHKTAPAQRITQVVEKGYYVSIQPSIGAAYIPSVRSTLAVKNGGSGTIYEYEAGNWTTAVVAGTSIELGRNVEKKLVMTLQYVKGIGNLNQTSITTLSNGKELVNTLNSKTSGWNLTAGIPISLGKKKEALKPVIQQVTPKREEPKREVRKCGEYRSRCGRVV
jgi:hypothetical protein